MTEHADNAKIFYDTCKGGFLYQHIKEFTRIRGNDHPSGLVFTRNVREIQNIEYSALIRRNDQ